MSHPCLCGAEDCPRCHPENYRRGVFIGDCLTEEEINEAIREARDAEEALAEYRAERRCK